MKNWWRNKCLKLGPKKLLDFWTSLLFWDSGHGLFKYYFTRCKIQRKFPLQWDFPLHGNFTRQWISIARGFPTIRGFPTNIESQYTLSYDQLKFSSFPCLKKCIRWHVQTIPLVTSNVWTIIILRVLAQITKIRPLNTRTRSEEQRRALGLMIRASTFCFMTPNVSADSPKVQGAQIISKILCRRVITIGFVWPTLYLERLCELPEAPHKTTNRLSC